MKKACVLVMAFLVSLALLAGVGWAAVMCVDPGGGGTHTSLQTALDTAETNGEDDVIKVVQGTYTGNFTYSSSEGYNITLEGGYTSGCASRVVNPANTILDGGGSGRVLELSHVGYMVIEGFTVQGGNTVDSSGGGIYALSLPSSITDNSGDIIINNNIIMGNNAAEKSGGGIHAGSFTNSAGTAGNITLTNNIITGNSANELGGGILVQSTSGAGTAGDVTIANNIITGNSAQDASGGIQPYAGYGGTLNIINNTIVGNTSSSGPGGIYLGNSEQGIIINVYNNIIWGNIGIWGADIQIYGTGGTANSYNNVYADMYGSWTGEGGNETFNPHFVDPGHWDDKGTPADPSDDVWVNGNYHLRPSSPCIDTGLNSAPGIPSKDFEGNDRIIDGDNNGTATADMGADEYVSAYVILHKDGAIWSSETEWNVSTPPYYPNSSYAVDIKYMADGSYTILHTDGALWNSETGWNLSTPPYYPGSAYAVELERISESATGGLWNQPASTSEWYANQDFETIHDAYDVFIADDFTITEPWNITTIYVPGNTWNPGTSLMNANTLHWQIYADAGGVPAGNPSGGTPPVWSLSLPPGDSQVTLSTGGSGYLSNVTLSLSTPVNLPAGTYWLVFYPQMDFDAWGQYGRHPSSTTNGYTAKVINPGGALGFPTTWTDVTAPSAFGQIGLTQKDFAFRIESMAGEQLSNVILHRDGALWSSATGWTLTTPPYYPNTDYARALELRADGSYVIQHKWGAVYDSATGWLLTQPPFYPGVDWAVDLKLDASGYVILHRDGAIWSTSGGWVLTMPPYYAGADYARALELVGSRYLILHKDGAIYDSVEGWNLETPPFYPGTNYAVDLEVQ